MSDIAEPTIHDRLDFVEADRVRQAEEIKTLRQQLSASRSEAMYFRTECRNLAVRGNAAQAIEENLSRRHTAHVRDLIPGDQIHAAQIVELEVVLDIVHSITGKATS